MVMANAATLIGAETGISVVLSIRLDFVNIGTLLSGAGSVSSMNEGMTNVVSHKTPSTPKGFQQESPRRPVGDERR
jgi:hypothetical protein